MTFRSGMKSLLQRLSIRLLPMLDMGPQWEWIHRQNGDELRPRVQFLANQCRVDPAAILKGLLV